LKNQQHYKYLIAVIYAVVLFLDRLDLTVVNVALPTVARYFDVSIVATDWISLAFLLALAISIPISTWLAERFGFKHIYIIAMILFGLGSTFCAFADSLNQLILLRFIQGLGGGMMMPVGMTMIYRVYDKSEYASITSFTFLPALVAPAIAPFLGGVLLDLFSSWRFVFVFSGPICLVFAVISLIFLREEPHHIRYPLDFKGFILAVIILTDIFYSLSALAKYGFTSPVVAGFLILIPLLALFIWIETHQKHPLIDLTFFRNKLFIQANLVQLCFQFCHMGAIFLVGLFLQAGIGFTATMAGLMMGMQAVSAMMVSRYSVRLFNQYGPRRPIIIGLVGVAILSPMLMLINTTGKWWLGLILFFVRGLFSGLCGTPIQTISVMAFDKKEMGTVNTIFNTCRQVSISLGVAASSVLIALGLHLAHVPGTANIPLGIAIHIFGYGFVMLSVVALIGVAVMSNFMIFNK
jgi:EmrB/QacA subfamily drug resistance transporter